MTSGPSNRDVCVVVPMFNEVASIGDVLDELTSAFPRVVCIDDGSTDGCALIAARLGVTVVQHPVNLGQGAAIQTGFTFALTQPGVRWIVTFDSDGQHRVSDAMALLDLGRSQGVDVVLGSRFLTGDGDVPTFRRLVLRAATLFTRVTTGLQLTDTHNGLRVLNRRAVEAMDLTLPDMAHASQLLGLIARNRLSFVEAPVTIDYTEYSRARGQSNLNAVNIAFDLAVERLRGRR